MRWRADGVPSGLQSPSNLDGQQRVTKVEQRIGRITPRMLTAPRKRKRRTNHVAECLKVRRGRATLQPEQRVDLGDAVDLGERIVEPPDGGLK